jgi:hypothetical protein
MLTTEKIPNQRKRWWGGFTKKVGFRQLGPNPKSALNALSKILYTKLSLYIEFKDGKACKIR